MIEANTEKAVFLKETLNASIESETAQKVEEAITEKITNSQSFKNWQEENQEQKESLTPEEEKESIKEYLAEYKEAVSQTALAEAANKEGILSAEELQEFYNREDELFFEGKNLGIEEYYESNDEAIEEYNNQISQDIAAAEREIQEEQSLQYNTGNEEDFDEASILENLGIGENENYNPFEEQEQQQSQEQTQTESQTEELKADYNVANNEIKTTNTNNEKEDITINSNPQLLELRQAELEKTLATAIILDTQSSEEFKNYQQQNSPEKNNIIDYYESLSKGIKEAADKEEREEKIEDLEYKTEILQKHFPNKETMIEEAQKINAEKTIKAVSELPEFKKFKEENILENGEKPNELDFLKKNIASKEYSPEELKRCEEQIAQIEKSFPEMDNSFQNLKKDNLNNEKAQKEKNNQIQKEKNKKSIKDKIKEHCDKNNQFTMNSDQLAQQILNDILFPLKALDLSFRNAQKDKENENKAKINFDGKMYNIEGYEDEYRKIKIQSIDGKEKYTVDNNIKFTAIYDNNALTPYQLEQLKEGRKMIIGQNGQVPLLAQMKQGQITFQTIDKETMDKNILARKGVDVNPNKKQTQTQTIGIKANNTPAPKKKNILGLKV